MNPSDIIAGVQIMLRADGQITVSVNAPNTVVGLGLFDNARLIYWEQSKQPQKPKIAGVPLDVNPAVLRNGGV